MPSFGKTAPLKEEHFIDFVKAYTAEDRHAVDDERWSVFTREQIGEKGDTLDLGLIRDDSVLDYNDLPDPADSAEVAAANMFLDRFFIDCHNISSYTPVLSGSHTTLWI